MLLMTGHHDARRAGSSLGGSTRGIRGAEPPDDDLSPAGRAAASDSSEPAAPAPSSDSPLAVVVNWNGGSLVLRAVESLARCRGAAAGLTVEVVDNASADGSREALLETYNRKPWFRLTANEGNRGYAAAANQGMRRALAESRDVLLFNPDAEMEAESLALLLQARERWPRAAVLAPRLLNLDGTLQTSLRDFPTPGNLLREHLLPGPWRRRRVARLDPHEAERAADWIVGAVWLVRRRALEEVGLFDEGFVTFHEETDLARRLAEAGWEVRLVPRSVARHAGGALAAGPGPGRDEVVVRYIPGKLRYLRKHHGPGAVLLLRLGLTLLWLGRLAASPWPAHRRRLAVSALRAAWGPAAGE